MVNKKSKNLYYLALLIGVAIFNIIFFLLGPDDKTEVIWVSYAVTMVAFALQFVAFATVTLSESLKDIFFSIPIMQKSHTYLILQLIMMVFFCFAKDVEMKIAVAVQLIVLLVFVALVVKAFMSKEQASSFDERLKARVLYINEIKVEIGRVSAEVDKSTFPQLFSKVEALRETAEYCDPMCHQSLAGIEQKIQSDIQQVGYLISSGSITEAENQIDEIQKLFNYRNERCKILK